MLAWTGPSWVTISPRSWFQIREPTMSLGIRSACTGRGGNVPRTRASAQPFARPGQ